VRARVEGFLATLGNGRHVLFTHGGVIRLLTRQVGEDDFVPTGTVVALDWAARRLLFKRACLIPSSLPFAE
jgi:probable phosphoglycerate mutase